MTGSDEDAPATTEPAELVILGSTGSIGTQALDVISAHPGRYRVRALAAGGGHADLLAAQAATHRADVVAVADPAAEPAVRRALTARGWDAQILTGPDAQAQVAGMLGPDGVVLNGITGSVGLAPTLAALRSGARLALANKESLVVGGALVQQAQQRPGQVVPVDSEHSAIAQALTSGRHEKGMTSAVVTGRSEVRRLILTASGGPFRGRSSADLARVTPEEALRHPNFAMGKVITTNSATLVNKALEVVEAHLLFDVPLADIETVVHPQQFIHSLVEFHDGSTVAQAGPPRMRVPIALGLSWPQRLPDVDEPLDWTRASTWDFAPLDHDAFPAVRLAQEACAASATHMAVYNAANEQAVHAFHAGRIPFPGILATVDEVLAGHDGVAVPDLPTLLAVESWARERADEVIARAG
ncbi:1-deoxy-D-xylulose-5-phosphate reductoisomerase [Georgenia deserti]|uniref:1-deoxy-D-xylulose 5-phosphate reductoisomerase n=1 Tax=Georgenia deserti TaxID=2093781 RepID=A0ABW4L889_9MICO